MNAETKQRMTEWEAKYKALLMGIDNPNYIENAEKVVRATIDMTNTTSRPFNECFHAICIIIGYQQFEDTKALMPKQGFFTRLKFAWGYLWDDR